MRITKTQFQEIKDKRDKAIVKLSERFDIPTDSTKFTNLKWLMVGQQVAYLNQDTDAGVRFDITIMREINKLN